MILLGLDLSPGEEIVGNNCGTGMHGGVMYIRGNVAPYKFGREVKCVEMGENDTLLVKSYIKRYCEYFNIPSNEVLLTSFKKIVPYNTRPYGSLYAPH